MDRWKAEIGRVREEKRREEERRSKREEKRREEKRGEEKRREEERISKRESLRRQKIQVREKLGNSRNTVFFQWFVAVEGRKVGSLKRRAEPAGQMRGEQLHAVVARSTFQSQHVKNITCWDHFWKLRCWKSARRCGWSTFRSQKCKRLLGTERFWTFRCGFAWQVQGILHLVKSEQNVRVFLAFPKTMASVGHLTRICKDAFSVAGAVQETCSSELFGGQGADFLRGVAFWSIRYLGLLRWFCVTGASTSYDPVSLFRGRRSSLDRWSGKIAKLVGTRPSALHSTFHFWRKSRRIVSFLMLSTPKIEEVSQTCFLSDVVKFKNWGRLAELFHFWGCQVQAYS